MNRKYVMVSHLIALLFISGCTAAGVQPPATAVSSSADIVLPPPRYESTVSIEEALHKRRSIRDYSDEPVSLAEISQLLWAGQGITGDGNLRTAPSAGATYPLETYLVAGAVRDLATGVYRYNPERHTLVKTIDGDKRAELAAAALGQAPVRKAAADIVFTAIYERTTAKYGERGIRYVHMEAGHAAENIYLQAGALNLGTVTIGAFDDEGVKKVLGLPPGEIPLYIMPVGRSK